MISLLRYNFEVEKIVSHPKFSFNTLKNDIALWFLKPNSVFTENNGTVAQLPEASKTSFLPMDEKVTVAGWGTKYSGSMFTASTLQEVDVTLVPTKECNKAYPGAIDDSQICAGEQAGGKDSCQGDSGGPLFKTNDDGEHVVFGIVSYGKGCALKGFPGVYTSVAYFRDWIDEQLAAYSK